MLTFKSVSLQSNNNNNNLNQNTMKQELHKTLNWMDKQEMIDIFDAQHMTFDGKTESEIREELREVAVDNKDIQAMIEAQE